MNRDTLVLYENIASLVTLSGVAAKKGRHPTDADFGIIENAAIVADSEKSIIEWVGKTEELPKEFQNLDVVYSDNPEVWLPELVECHTHLLYGGNRYHDFAERCRGKSYQEVAAAGGGILSTVKATRDASIYDLVEHGKAEMERFQRLGIGTIEAKTGYGLTLESELKCLKAMQQLQGASNVYLIPTFMPAHAVPPEYKGKVDSYVDAICSEWIPTVAKAKLAAFFDAFIEDGYFTAAHAEKMARVALDNGLKIKFHVDQFTDQGGTALGLDMKATSLDHLEVVSEANIARLGNSDTVAVLAPGASLFTKTCYAPARKLIDAGARVALTTDYNPGTCPSRNLPLMTTIACCRMDMTVAEAIAAVTYNAAAALGLEDKIGSVEKGKLFRVCQLKSGSIEALPYCFGELD